MIRCPWKLLLIYEPITPLRVENAFFRPITEKARFLFIFCSTDQARQPCVLVKGEPRSYLSSASCCLLAFHPETTLSVLMVYCYCRLKWPLQL